MQPISAGVVSALVAFTSTFAVVLAGLSAAGADPAQAAGGLMVVTVLMGLGSILLAVWSRQPITIAWSTPGAALLASTGAVEGGWPAAVGAFLVVGLLVVATGLIPALGDLIARIPPAVAQAMLAGVLLQLCLGPIEAAVAQPAEALPVILVWLVGLRLFPRWAVPSAFAAAAVVVAVHVLRTGQSIDPAGFVPHLHPTAPQLSAPAVLGLAVPLFLVTMASQNVPGAAVMQGLGYHIPWRRSMTVTGLGSLLGATGGAPGVNLAAISAALAAGPEAGEDRSRRWIASVASGCLLVLIGLGAGAFGALVSLAPEGVIPAVAGLALLGTFASSLRAALERTEDLVPAAVTFAVVASGVSVAGMSAAFWALVAGLSVRWVLRWGRTVPTPDSDRAG